MTEKQKALKAWFGTPEKFEEALLKAVVDGWLNVREAWTAIDDYSRDWEEAGRPINSPCRVAGDGKNSGGGC
jgi:hypothetical protein